VPGMLFDFRLARTQTSKTSKQSQKETTLCSGNP